MQPVVKGYLAVLIAAFFWGSQGIIGKKVMLDGFDPIALAAFRMTLTFFILLAGILIFKPEKLKIEIKDIPFFLLFGLIGVGVFHACFNYAIYYTGVSIAVMLLYTAPAFTAIISSLLLKEPLTKNKIIAVCLTVIGCIAITWAGSDELNFNLLGILFGLLTGLSYALWNVMCKKAVTKYSPLTVNLYSIGTGSLVLLLMTINRTGQVIQFQAKTLLIIAFMALANTILPDSIYAYSMKFLDASTASVLANAELIIAIILAWLLYHEPLSGFRLLGFLTILLAIGVLVWEDFMLYETQQAKSQSNL